MARVITVKRAGAGKNPRPCVITRVLRRLRQERNHPRPETLEITVKHRYFYTGAGDTSCVPVIDTKQVSHRPTTRLSVTPTRNSRMILLDPLHIINGGHRWNQLDVDVRRNNGYYTLTRMISTKLEPIDNATITVLLEELRNGVHRLTGSYLH